MIFSRLRYHGTLFGDMPKAGSNFLWRGSGVVKRLWLILRKRGKDAVGHGNFEFT
jgi:hypothetical protein